MTTLIQITTAAALILSIIVPFGYFFLGEKSKKRYKKSLAANCFFFFGTLLVGTIVAFSGTATVQAAADTASAGLATGLGYLGAALVTGLSGIGSGIAVASSASAALGAISEDGSLFGKSMIFVAMAEGIALYGLIISFMILGQL
ncbi:MAG TPA: ATP synthase subunit C [Candidatus Blautia gallistercoris]|uniref:ATP synthase F(0) sector subunit c n=1 Tax=Candidatus Blautia gallistercoris TaxID=2838490 RepID=A0A9D1WLD7_9FIRM|nr:ATP synthase subunit C [Candidatus Blautia gallistercoris]